MPPPVPVDPRASRFSSSSEMRARSFTINGEAAPVCRRRLLRTVPVELAAEYPDEEHGTRSLSDAMAMLKRQVAITPPPQWVRVVGGFTEHQFAGKRLPTIEEINPVAPDTPVYTAASISAAAAAFGHANKPSKEAPVCPPR
jgi:hypothetical protein